MNLDDMARQRTLTTEEKCIAYLRRAFSVLSCLLLWLAGGWVRAAPGTRKLDAAIGSPNRNVLYAKPWPVSLHLTKTAAGFRVGSMDPRRRLE